ncbi:hypothetical protein [Nocardiopsis halotolerans]|uniref:hypothetical protein n=1 Tax=Nocardiopsis halotolerans TaxID=124252 RepID=UPI001360B09D|nr:hypothetical protein [Nocardiopsis halotolerans]
MRKCSARRRRHRGARPYLIRYELLVEAASAVTARPLARWRPAELDALTELVSIWRDQ